MSVRDRDLISVQEARELVARAAEAQRKFASFSQEQVDAIVEACATAATEAGEQLARTAVEETGYGNVPDKIIKNRVGSVEVPRAIRGMKTVGIIREDAEKGVVEMASPVGVVAAVIPTTNPTSTAIYKTLISIKARNAVVHSPHPSAVKCIRQTVEVLARAATQAGAPEGLIACMENSTMQGTQELMRLRDVGVILATGGAGLVRQAYSSGRPAYGVGPGNVPAYIERTANVRKAVADVIAGKTFDYGTICSSEQSIVADDVIREQALEECRRNGAHFLTADEMKAVSALVLDPVRHVPNPKIVGKHATVIAEIAGINVHPETRVLIARLEPQMVGREYPLSAEKLSPILAFYSVANTAAAIELCQRLLRFGGAGHTCAVHTQDEKVAKEFGAAMPAFRVCVNTSAVHGSIGYSTRLFPAMTLGCGSPGGNITSDNIGPHHLMNIKRVAWESRAVEHRTIPHAQRLAGSAPMAAAAAAGAASPAATSAGGRSFSSDKSAAESKGASAPEVSVDRATIARIVERVFKERGIARSDAAPDAAEKTTKDAEAQSTQSHAEEKPKAVAAPAAGPGFNPTEAAAPTKNPGSSQAKPETVPFVSENDVRMAITKNQKIFIGPKTIVTPSARDLASGHDVIIETA